jgi:hypothetical protein
MEIMNFAELIGLKITHDILDTYTSLLNCTLCIRRVSALANENPRQKARLEWYIALLCRLPMETATRPISPPISYFLTTEMSRERFLKHKFYTLFFVKCFG